VPAAAWPRLDPTEWAVAAAEVAPPPTSPAFYMLRLLTDRVVSAPPPPAKGGGRGRTRRPARRERKEVVPSAANGSAASGAVHGGGGGDATVPPHYGRDDGVGVCHGVGALPVRGGSARGVGGSAHGAATCMVSGVVDGVEVKEGVHVRRAGGGAARHCR